MRFFKSLCYLSYYSRCVYEMTKMFRKLESHLLVKYTLNWTHWQHTIKFHHNQHQQRHTVIYGGTIDARFRVLISTSLKNITVFDSRTFLIILRFSHWFPEILVDIRIVKTYFFLIKLYFSMYFIVSLPMMSIDVARYIRSKFLFILDYNLYLEFVIENELQIIIKVRPFQLDLYSKNNKKCSQVGKFQFK